MLVMSQLPIQTTQFFYSIFDVNLCPPNLKKVPPPMGTTLHPELDVKIAFKKYNPT